MIRLMIGGLAFGAMFGSALTAAAAADTASAAAPSATELQPFNASYSVFYRGMNAGTTELELKRDADDRFIYTSRSNARGLFRLFLGNEILQTSTFSLTAQGVRPLRYRGDDGSSSTERDIRYDFDWQTRRVQGVEENEPVDIALSDGVQDPMSIQIALLYDLLRGVKPTHYSLIDKQILKTYEYTSEGSARIKTELGELDTIIYLSQRQGSKRKTRMWHAPSLGFVPVQAEQIRDGKREWLMQIKTLDR